MLNKKENRASSDELIIHTDNKEVEFKELLLTTEQDLWIEAKSATKKMNVIKFLTPNSPLVINMTLIGRLSLQRLTIEKIESLLL
jgi:hypothetical protein